MNRYNRTSERSARDKGAEAMLFLYVTLQPQIPELPTAIWQSGGRPCWQCGLSGIHKAAALPPPRRRCRGQGLVGHARTRPTRHRACVRISTPFWPARTAGACSIPRGSCTLPGCGGGQPASYEHARLRGAGAVWRRAGLPSCGGQRRAPPSLRTMPPAGGSCPPHPGLKPGDSLSDGAAVWPACCEAGYERRRPGGGRRASSPSGAASWTFIRPSSADPYRSGVLG